MARTVDEVWQLLGALISSPKQTERLSKQQTRESDRRFPKKITKKKI